jgi:chitin-binding protein
MELDIDVLLDTERTDYQIRYSTWKVGKPWSVGQGGEAEMGQKNPHFTWTQTKITPGEWYVRVVATPVTGQLLQKNVPFTVHAEADFVFPEGLEQYKAGTTVLQPKDGHTYECKQGQAAGYCVQWKEHANAYEPGIGAHWQEAWIRK